jgi:hypothetical protein
MPGINLANPRSIEDEAGEHRSVELKAATVVTEQRRIRVVVGDCVIHDGSGMREVLLRKAGGRISRWDEMAEEKYRHGRFQIEQLERQWRWWWWKRGRDGEGQSVSEALLGGGRLGREGARGAGLASKNRVAGNCAGPRLPANFCPQRPSLTSHRPKSGDRAEQLIAEVLAVDCGSNGDEK